MPRRWSAFKCCLYAVAVGLLAATGATGGAFWMYQHYYPTWEEFFRRAFWPAAIIYFFPVGAGLGALMYTIQWYMNRRERGLGPRR